MRMLTTSLGTWDTIETGRKGRHGMTYPLAIVSALVEDAGYGTPDCVEGHDGPPLDGGDYDLLLVSMMDPRHMWRLPAMLDRLKIDRLAAERGEGSPMVIVGGQAATAPAPIEVLADIVYVGEAEANLIELLAVIDRGRASGWSRTRVLESCAAVPGCLVPTHFPAGHVVEQVYAEDIGISLRRRMNVNLRTIHRVEVARGCKGPAARASKDPTKSAACGFCVLGWRSKYRENSAEDIAAALRDTAASGIREVHLSAGDAEGHSQIEELRQTVRAIGLRDHGWTGRLDTMRDCSVSAGKHFAFGLEGASHRLRRAIGKGRLSDDYIVQRMGDYWRAGGRMAMWHLIGGLPGETDEDARALVDLLHRVESEAASTGERMHLSIGRQPFGPMPHTPMQWAAPGLSTDRLGAAVRRHRKGRSLAVLDKHGQREAQALIHAVVLRGGPEVRQVVLDGRPTIREGRFARRQAEMWLRSYGLDPGRYYGEWDPAEPTPWSHIRSAYPLAELQRHWRRIRAAVGLT